MSAADDAHRRRQGSPAVRPQSGPGAQAQACLRGSSHLSLTNITCELQDGVLILWGRVPSYYLKQLASALVAEVAGVERIDNRIEVTTGAAPRPAGRTAQPADGGERQ